VGAEYAPFAKATAGRILCKAFAAPCGGPWQRVELTQVIAIVGALTETPPKDIPWPLAAF
jgi:hypothetical protein